MTRRIVIAIVGSVVVALVLAGLGTLALTYVSARRLAETDLRKSARQLSTALAGVAEITRPGQDTPTVRPNVLKALRDTLELNDLTVMVFGPKGNTADDPPPGLTMADLETPKLLAGQTVSGSRGGVVYAASGAAVGDKGTLVVVLSRRPGAGIGPSAAWFLLASLVTLIGASVAAVALGRRLARPVVDAQRVTARIAAGDLTARLPDPPPEARDELAGLARSVNTMADELDRSRTLDQRFLLSVSHDLRTPLTSIRGYAESIVDGAADPAWAAGIILSESRRLQRLVTDLLDLARLENRTFSLQPVPLDLADTAAGVLDGFRPDATESGVDLELVAPEPVEVLADPDRIAQVVANLVQNALKFARRTVVVGVGRRGPRVELVVDDDGPGIAPEDLPHVFERLYVSRHQPARKEAGSGLGLAIVRELVEAHGGSVAAGSAPGGGARFTVWLPAAP